MKLSMNPPKLAFGSRYWATFDGFGFWAGWRGGGIGREMAWTPTFGWTFG